MARKAQWSPRTLFAAAFVAMQVAGCKNPKIESSRGPAPLAPGLTRVEVRAPVDLVPDTTTPANPSSPRCPLTPGARFVARNVVSLGAFLRLELNEPLAGCALQAGYVPMQGVVVVEGSQPIAQAAPMPSAPPPASPPLPAITAKPPGPKPPKAFLDVIAYAEGTKGRGDDGYNVMFTHKLFRGYADHPRQTICAGICSTAAGRYQFLDFTWDGVRKAIGARDFGKANQDKGGLYLARNRGVTNYNQAWSRTDFSNAIRKLGKEWASLPGSPYGQPVKTMDELWREYQKYLK
jgi:muramidase (phage lysozyme)